KSAHRIFSRGWRKMKLYFMIGLPTEEEADVRGIADLGKRMLSIAQEYLPKGRANVTISVSSHIPKPFTPFQWAAMDDIPEIEKKQQALRKWTRAPGLTFRWHDPTTSHIEGILSRGDRVLCDVVETAWRNGARFDGWSDRLRFDLWMEAIEEHQIDRYRYLGTIPIDARLPWDHIDCGVEHKFLVKEYQKSLKDRTSHPCGKPGRKLTHYNNLEDATADKRRLVCYDCGIVCDLARMKEERIESLEYLDAHRDEAQASSQTDASVELVREQSRERFFARKNHTLPPVRKELDRPSFSYRVRYAKVGTARFMGHLDLNRMFPRAIRRAGFSPSYSQGFHPIPRMAFGPPLRLGMAGLSEVVDLRLQQQVDPESLHAALAAQCPEGVELRSIHVVGKDAPKLSAVTSWADVFILLPRESAVGIRPDAIDQLLAESEIIVERRTKKGKFKTIDIRPGIDGISWVEEVPEDAAGLMSLREDERMLQMRICLQGEHPAKPEEILLRLFEGTIPTGTQVIRRRLLPSPTPTLAISV
ncbi:MAG TPA: DUF2344 domain-containing protein, partial [Planctomycetes bacterium]|nr:DUF2344 domain-containing protein [Planctomycetota bacterium]